MTAVRHALSDAPALDRRALAALTGPVVLGFSGGGDSTALLRRLSGLKRLTAIIVDHALRPGSQEDAARAARFAEALGVPARIVTLAWPPGAKCTQAALRRARHVALYEAARSLGASVVALAHTADDQAETVMMRAARVGWRRAVGMAPLSPAPIWPEGRGIVIARPLLDVRRKALRAWLTAQGAEWIEDPANENAAFERVRVRRRLAEASDGEVMRLVRLAAGLRVRADRAAAAAAAWFRHVDFAGPAAEAPWGWFEGPAAAHAVRVLIAAVSGAPSPPSLARAAALAARVSRADFRGATLGGARLTRRGQRVSVTRDPGAVLGRAGQEGLAPLPLPPGEETVWDGRLALTVDRRGWRAAPAERCPATPVLTKGARRVPLHEAPWARARWLLRDRAAHLLGAGAG